MKITKINIKNYKLLKDVCIPLNPDINIFVGDNDAGKSTLLEAITIAVTGKLKGFPFQRQLKDNIFNIETRNAFIASLGTEAPMIPPKIIIEVYCDGDDVAYSGTNNERGENCNGIRVLAGFDTQYSQMYREMLDHGQVRDIPVEFYNVSFTYFSGDTVYYPRSPLKAIFVDTTRKDYTGVVDRFVSENITEYLSDQDQVDLSLAYRRVRAAFSESDTISRLNENIQRDDRLQGRNVSLGLQEDGLDDWKRQMAISVDEIPFEQVGFGTQNSIKVELAVKNTEDKVNMILMEEPENNLSYGNMASLVRRISESKGKQIFISTHSSYIANKLNLKNLLLVRNGVVLPFTKLSDDTVSYFEKLPGYNTLRMVLSNRVILVEGPTDDLIIQRAFLDKNGKLPTEAGIDIIAVGALAFKRYCDIAILMKKMVAVVTDNDGNIGVNINEKYKDYITSPYIRFFYETDQGLKTIEPSVLAVNCDENGNPTEYFKRILAKGDSLLARDYDGMLTFMSGNKSEWALRVFESDRKIQYPEYIRNVIDEYS